MRYDGSPRLSVVLAVTALAVLAGCPATNVGLPGTETGTAPATGTTPAGASDVVTPPLNVSAVLEAHAAAMERSGSVTLRGNSTVRGSGREVSEWRVGRYDFDTGERLETHKWPWSGALESNYRAPNGSSYRWHERSTGETFFLGPDTVDGPPLSPVLRPSVFDYATEEALAYEGRTTRAGVTGHVYAVSNASAFAAAHESVNSSEVLAYEFVLVLADAGYVKYARSNVTVDSGEGPVTIESSVRFEDVGETTVPVPSWFGAAAAKAQ